MNTHIHTHICICIYVCVCVCVIQSSSNELSTPVSDSVKCLRTKVNTFALNSRADFKVAARLSGMQSV